MVSDPTGRPPFRAEHIGSLLRPARLRQAFRQHAQGEIDDATFRQIQDARIRDVLRLQHEAGLTMVTDGEFRRGSYWSRFVERVDGLTTREAMVKFRDDHGHEEAFTAPYVAGKLRRRRSIALDEFIFVRDAVAA